MKTVTSYAQWFNNECERASKEAFEKLCVVGNGEQYLWFKTLSLVVATDKPEGYELATPERIPGHLTVQQLNMWIHARSTHLPILPTT